MYQIVKRAFTGIVLNQVNLLACYSTHYHIKTGLRANVLIIPVSETRVQCTHPKLFFSVAPHFFSGCLSFVAVIPFHESLLSV